MRCRAFTLAALVAICGACRGQIANPLARTCQDDSGCEEGDACVEGVCVSTELCGDARCPAGEACIEGRCLEPACVGVACPVAGEVCVGGACVEGDCARKEDGASCTDEGDACTRDECSAGTCVHRPMGDGELCGVAKVCRQGSCVVGCWIDGALVASGTVDPSSPCRGCLPWIAVDRWSDQLQGVGCPDDGNPCSRDACDGSGGCAHALLADGTGCGSSTVCISGSCGPGCSIAGAAYPNGQIDPTNACRSCQSSVTNAAWTPRPAATACADDGNACTRDECDANGNCAHPAVPDGSNCGPDRLCHTGSCVSGCWIGGAFYPSGAVSPTNPCRSCQPVTSTLDWSDRVAGSACTDDGNVCTVDICAAGAVCTHPAAADGLDCGKPHLVCRAGVCGSEGGADAGTVDAGAADAGRDGGGTGDAGGGGSDAGTSLDAGTEDAGAGDSGSADAGGVCSLASSTSVVAVAADPSSSWPVIAAPLAGDGAAIAWTGTSGSVYLARVGSDGARLGSDWVIAGVSGHAMAVLPNGFGLLVRRRPANAAFSDELWLVLLDTAGNVTLNQKLVGGNDPNVVQNEWFDGFYRRGRIVWSGSRLSTYFSIQRRWPDNVAHQGDTLRHYGLDGSLISGGWDWGCSHSLDLRMAASGSTLGPVCLSDCYPSKAVLFNHTQEVAAEPSGNCAGGSNARLGGLVPDASGFWLTWTSDEGRSSSDVVLVRLGSTGGVSSKSWLTQNGLTESAPHLARFGTGLLAGWRESTSSYWLLGLSSSGAPVGAPEQVPVKFGDSDDFFTYSGGDVGWAWGSAGQVSLARVRRCP